MSQLFLMIGVRLVWAFFNFYLIIVAIRILGTIFVTRKERLGWFQHAMIPYPRRLAEQARRHGQG